MEVQWLDNFVRRQKLKYFGHLKRSEGLWRIVLEGRINGKRGKGRPRRQWERDMEDAFNRPITETGRLALDRERFEVLRRPVE